MASDASMKQTTWIGDVTIILGVFVLATAVAAAFGAANFGTALTFGQIGFAVAVVAMMLER
jgi:hypothetical protein